MRPLQNEPAASATTATPTLSPAHLDGSQVLAAFAHASAVLADHREQLNALNVFPVPDGDTGTNMTMTMRSAIDAAHKASPDTVTTPAGVLERIAWGALMGARGNSGVILSQILRGFADSIATAPAADGPAIATALASATHVAYGAVLQPVEGTMLTVIADAARAAEAMATHDRHPGAVLAAAADAATESLMHTPEALDVLREAQVVDAGGQGVAYLLRALANHINGVPGAIQIGEESPVPTLANITIVDEDIHSGVSGYCTNFIVAARGQPIDLDRFRARLGEIGDSTVIVGDADLFKVHIHTDRPDQALAVALEHGNIDRVAIENMERQADEVAAAVVELRQASAPAVGPLSGRQAVVTVADGPGLADVLRGMGATVVIELGQEGKPSTEELLRAVEAAPADEVILLPNRSEIVPAARMVTGMTGKTLAIVPTVSVSQGIAALAAMNATSDIASNERTMTQAARTANWAEIATAAKDAITDGIAVHAGDELCFVNDTLRATGRSAPEVLAAALPTAPDLDPEICTIFTGVDATARETASLVEVLTGLYAEAEIDTLDGGQSYYRFVIDFG